MAEPKRGEQPSHADLRHDLDMHWMVLQRVEKAVKEGFESVGKELSDLKKTVGDVGTDERGALIGTGIAGDLGRLRERVDKRFGLYDGWVKYAAGALASLTVLGAVVWWLIENKVEEVFR